MKTLTFIIATIIFASVSMSFAYVIMAIAIGGRIQDWSSGDVFAWVFISILVGIFLLHFIMGAEGGIWKR